MDRVYITDLDKTFLKNDLSVGNFSKEVWNALVKKGVLLGVATARSMKKSLEFLDGLHFNAPLVFLDGAMVVTAEKKVILSNTLDYELSLAIVSLSKKEFFIEPFIVGYDKNIVDEKFLYPSVLNGYQKQLIASYRNDSRLQAKKELHPLQNNFKIVYMGKKEEMIALEKRLKEVFGDAIEIKNGKDVYFDCWFLTVLHPLGDKAHALDAVCEYVGKTSEELCVFGDSLNDIGMFQKAQTAIAVANAHDEVKKHANIVLDKSNEEEAVAFYLQAVIR